MRSPALLALGRRHDHDVARSASSVFLRDRHVASDTFSAPSLMSSPLEGLQQLKEKDHREDGHGRR